MAGVQRCAACGIPIRCSARREGSKGTRREDTMLHALVAAKSAGVQCTVLPLREALVRPVVLCVFLTLTTPLTAQAGRRTAEHIEAAFNAHRGEFDYLLGDWE